MHRKTYTLILNLPSLILGIMSKPRTLNITLQDITTTSLTIGWKINGNSSCGNYSLLTIVYTRMLKCPNQTVPTSLIAQNNVCNNKESVNMSSIWDVKNTSLKINSLTPNSTYNLVVELQFHKCEDIVYATAAIFQTLTLGKCNFFQSF